CAVPAGGDAARPAAHDGDAAGGRRVGREGGGRAAGARVDRDDGRVPRPDRRRAGRRDPVAPARRRPGGADGLTSGGLGVRAHLRAARLEVHDPGHLTEEPAEGDRSMTGSPTVLVTGAGGPAGRALGSQLSARAASAVDAAVGRAVAGVGVDVVPVAGGAFPVTDQAPRADAWDYVTGMRDLVVRYAPDLVIPTVQDELPQVATLAQALAGESPPAGRWTFPDAVGVVLTADPGPAALAADKLLTMLALEKAGVPVPPVRGADGLRQHGGGAGRRCCGRSSGRGRTRRVRGCRRRRPARIGRR